MKQNYLRNLLLAFLMSMFGLQVTHAQCGLDIYILNDNSGSVDATEYRQSKEFITRLAAEFLPLGVANNQTRIAIGDFAEKNSFIQFDFPTATTQYATDFSDIVYYEKAPRILSGATDINDAVEEASLVSGLPVIPGRNVAQVLVILTDAYPSQVAPSIISFANTLKSQGFAIVVMAIDAAITDTELPQIASAGGYFTAGDYQALEDDVITYAQNLATQACTYVPPTPKPDLNIALTNFNIINCLTTPTSSVSYQVNNVGDASFSGSLYISLYDADPRIPGANLLGVRNVGATTIAAGSSASGTITSSQIAGLNSASTLYAVVNFIGSYAGNQVPVSAQPSQSQLAITTPVAEKITTNNFSSGRIVTLGAGCNTAILDMNVSSTGGGCEDEVTYTVQVCNNGAVSASLDDLLVAPAPGFSLVSSSGFCTSSAVYTQLGQNVNANNAGDIFHVTTLSSDGHTMVVSGRAMDNGALTDVGGTKVFDYNTVSGQWVQRGQTIYGTNANDLFGWDNDITSNGNRIAIGGYGNDSRRGAVRIYDWNSGTGQWQQVGNTLLGNAANDDLGSVAISGDGQRIIVSAANSLNDEGRVAVYRLVSGTWTQMGSSFVGVANDNLGHTSDPKAIDISNNGNRIFMGGSGIDAGGLTDNGQVRIYDWNGAAWVAKPFINGPSDGYREGNIISVTPDGNTLATVKVSATSHTIRVFFWNGSSWVQKGVAFSRDYIKSISLSDDGNRLAVGKNFIESLLFEFNGSQWVQIQAFAGVAGQSAAINGEGSIVAFGVSQYAANNGGLVQVFEEPKCIIAPGECKTVNYVYNVSGASAGTYDFDVVLNASKTNAAHANPVINPDKNFLTQNSATTGSGWDGSKHAEENVTIFSAAFCSTTHTIGMAMTLSPTAVCTGSFTTATVTITNPYPISITGTNLVLNLGNGATYVSEPYNRNGIVMPTFPGLNGTTGSNTIPVYTLAPGTNTFLIDIAVATGTNTLTAQLTNIDPAYNNGSATTTQISRSVTGQANPTITGTCPAAVTSGATTINLNYSVSGATTIIWNSGTNGVFTSPNTGVTTYTINSQDRANGFVDFTLTAKSSTGCDEIIICRVNITNVGRDYGDAPITYDLGETTIPVAAAHSLKAGLHLGVLAPDAETANQPSANASLEAEDDGLTVTNIAAVGGTTYKLPVSVTNTTSTVAYANAFIDWNKDGDFLDDMESGVTVTVPATSATATYMVNFNVPSGVAINDPLYIRLRVAEEESAVRRSFGAAGGGEVEDFYLLAASACRAGDNAPVISGIDFDPQPTTAGELIAGITVNNQPAGTVMTVHSASPATDANKLGNASPLSAGNTYYIAFWDETYSCYSPTTAIPDCPLIDHEPFIYHLFDELTGDPNNTQQLYKQLYYGQLPFICPTTTGCNLNASNELYATTNITGTISNLAYGDSKYYVIDAFGDLLITSNLVEGNFVNIGNAQVTSSYVNLAYDNGVFYRWDRVGATNSVQLYSSTDPVNLGWTLMGGMSLSFSYTEGPRTYQLADMAAHDGVFYFMYYTTDVSTAASGNANRTRTFSSTTPLTTPNGGWTTLGTSYFGFGVTNIAFGGEDVFAACGIEVCPAGSNAPVLAQTTFDPAPAGVADLIALLSASNMPANTEFSVHTASPATYDNRLVSSAPLTPNTTYYVAFWNEEYECYSPATSITLGASLCTGSDSDGDGILDMCDLDDDNDGILDADECGESNIVVRGDFTVLPSSPGLMSPAQFATATSNNWTFTSTGTGTNAQILWDNITGPVVFGNGIRFQRDGQTQSITQSLTDWYHYEKPQIVISKIAANNSTPTGRSSTLILTYGGVEYVRIVTGNSTGTAATLTYSNGASGSLTSFAVGTVYNNWVIELPNDIPASGDLKFDFLAGPVDSDDFSIGDVIINACQDTDNDGIPNYLDLDSDNDGCLDAIEGDENVTNNMLVNAGGTVIVGTGSTASNQNLGNTVDSNGVPTIVNSGGTADIGGDVGQGVGSSIDATVNTCYCYKPGILDAGNSFPTKHGITALGRAGAENENWPMTRQSAWTVLESKEKGFVVNRVATTSGLANITNPVEGMMVYDEEVDCLKIYTLKSGDTVMGWHCFITPACPD